MELKFDIGYEQIWTLVQQLPKSQQSKLKTDLEKLTNSSMLTQWQKNLLDGPIMTNEGLENTKNIRKQLNKRWKTD
jgi:hypothetical protein